MQFSPFSRHLIPFRSKYPPQHPVLKHPQSVGCLSKESVQVLGLCKLFVTGFFYGEELLTPRPTPKLEGHPLLSVRDCLFNIFAANLHSWRPFLLPQPEDAPCCGDRDPTCSPTVYFRENFTYVVRFPDVQQKQNKLRDLSPRANYTDGETAACRRNYFQVLLIEWCHVISAADPVRP
jgi:hypothetical protein